MSLQSTHTTTINSLQRELEALRETNRLVKIQLRDLEMGNDDLERHERFALSMPKGKSAHLCYLELQRGGFIP